MLKGLWRWGSLEFEGAKLLIDDLPYYLIRCHDSDKTKRRRDED